MSPYAAIITLILIMDPVGNIPVFISLLRHVPQEQRSRVLFRESLIAFGIIVSFLFGGHVLLDAMNLSDASLNISGGIILFIIAIRMIFPDQNSSSAQLISDPFIVPIATPLIAGPSTLAWVMLIGAQEVDTIHYPFFVIFVAWLISTTILLIGFSFSRFIGERGLIALERLMGMLLTMISVQMLLGGIAEFYHIGL